jgi:hypothetical protein
LDTQKKSVECSQNTEERKFSLPSKKLFSENFKRIDQRNVTSDAPNPFLAERWTEKDFDNLQSQDGNFQPRKSDVLHNKPAMTYEMKGGNDPSPPNPNLAMTHGKPEGCNFSQLLENENKKSKKSESEKKFKESALPFSGISTETKFSGTGNGSCASSVVANVSRKNSISANSVTRSVSNAAGKDLKVLSGIILRSNRETRNVPGDGRCGFYSILLQTAKAGEGIALEDLYPKNRSGVSEEAGRAVGVLMATIYNQMTPDQRNSARRIDFSQSGVGRKKGGASGGDYWFDGEYLPIVANMYGRPTVLLRDPRQENDYQVPSASFAFPGGGIIDIPMAGPASQANKSFSTVLLG